MGARRTFSFDISRGDDTPRTKSMSARARVPSPAFPLPSATPPLTVKALSRSASWILMIDALRSSIIDISPSSTARREITSRSIELAVAPPAPPLPPAAPPAFEDGPASFS